MKKILKVLLIGLVFIPNTVLGAFTTGWQATSTTQGWINPSRINGVDPIVVAKQFIASSTSAASVFPYASTTALTISGALYNTSLSNGCLNVTSGLISSTGSACGSGGGGGTFSWTPTTNYGVTVNATTTPIWFQAGLHASTTSYFSNASTTLSTVLNTAFFPGSGIWNSAGQVGIGLLVPTDVLSVNGAVAITGARTGATGLVLSDEGVYKGIQSFNSEPIVLNLQGNNVAIGNDTTPDFILETIGTFGVSSAAAGDGNLFVVNSAGRVGVGTSTPYAKLSVAGEVVGAYFTATTTTASTFRYASTTGITASYASSTLYFGADLTDCDDPTNSKLLWSDTGRFSCGSDQTGAGGSVDGSGVAGMMASWTDGNTIQATSTIVGSHFIATSTTASQFPNASTTLASVATSLWITPLTSALLQTDAAGLTAEYAGTSCTNQFVRSLSALGVATCATVGSADVSLANLTATDSTLTFSGTYNGSTARTIGLNLGNENVWTALQTFGNASTTLGSFGYASSTLWYGGGLQTCNATTGKLHWANGVFTCETDGGGGGGEANTASSLGTGLNIFDSKSGVDLRFNTIAAGTNITLSTTTNNNTIVINSTASGGGGAVGGFSNLATSTSMSIDICDSAYATSSINVLKKAASNITVTMSGSACLGKYIFIDDVAPLTGVIATTTYSGVFWNGQINPGSGTVNGLTDRFMFAVTATTTTFISAKLDSSY